LAHEQELIGEVVVCRSETKLPNRLIKLKFDFIARCQKLSAPIIISTVSKIARDGENRNRGWAECKFPYIAFMDADDKYSRNRLKTLGHLMKLTNADVLLHNYSKENEIQTPNLTTEEFSEVLKLKLSIKEQTFTGFGKVTDLHDNEVRVHFAHVTVRNQLKSRISFTPRFPGADMEFSQQAIFSGLEVNYYPVALSEWGRKRSFRYRLRLLLQKHFK